MLTEQTAIRYHSMSQYVCIKQLELFITQKVYVSFLSVTLYCNFFSYLLIVPEFKPSGDDSLVRRARSFRKTYFPLAIRVCKYFRCVTTDASCRRAAARFCETSRKKWRIVRAFRHCRLVLMNF